METRGFIIRHRTSSWIQVGSTTSSEAFATQAMSCPAFDQQLDAFTTGEPLDGVRHRIDPSDHEMRTEAANFILHAVRRSIQDHVLCESEADAIEELKYVFGLDEGDLPSLQPAQTRDFMSSEIGAMVADGAIDDAESLRKSGLQRALGLGYDQFLFLAQDGNLIWNSYPPGSACCPCRRHSCGCRHGSRPKCAPCSDCAARRMHSWPCRTVGRGLYQAFQRVIAHATGLSAVDMIDNLLDVAVPVVGVL